MSTLGDLLDEGKQFVAGAGDIALSGQQIVNKLTGQTQPQAGPILANSQAVQPQGATPGMPPWVWMAGAVLAVVVALVFAFGGRKR